MLMYSIYCVSVFYRMFFLFSFRPSLLIFSTRKPPGIPKKSTTTTHLIWPWRR